MTRKEIWKKFAELETERREYSQSVMKSFDVEHYRKVRELQEECGNTEQGHNFVFSDLGPTGKAWFYCSCCGKNEVKD